MLRNRVTVIRGSKFDVHKDGFVREVTEGTGVTGRPIEIPRGARIQITGIDFYINRVSATWEGRNILLDYEFVVRNLQPVGPILTSTVQALEVIECEPEPTKSSFSNDHSVDILFLLTLGCVISSVIVFAMHFLS